MDNPQFSRDDVKILDKKTAFQGFFRIDKYLLQHKLFEGGWSSPFTREVFERGHSAAIIPYDVERDTIVFSEQFRIGALEDERSPWLLEIVAGAMDNEGESPTSLVVREAKEEAGIDISDIIPICEYWVSPGGMSEKLHLFCGRVDSNGVGGIHGVDSEFEDIRAFTATRAEAMQAMKDGLINNSAAIIALQWLELNHAMVRERWCR